MFSTIIIELHSRAPETSNILWVEECVVKGHISQCLHFCDSLTHSFYLQTQPVQYLSYQLLLTAVFLHYAVLHSANMLTSGNVRHCCAFGKAAITNSCGKASLFCFNFVHVDKFVRDVVSLFSPVGQDPLCSSAVWTAFRPYQPRLLHILTQPCLRVTLAGSIFFYCLVNDSFQSCFESAAAALTPRTARLCKKES